MEQLNNRIAKLSNDELLTLYKSVCLEMRVRDESTKRAKQNADWLKNLPAFAPNKARRVS